MSRISRIVIKDLPFDTAVDLLKTKEVLAYAAKHDISAVNVYDVSLNGFHVKTSSGKSVNFSLPGDLTSYEDRTASQNIQYLEYSARHLSMNRYEHRHEFPELFANECTVVWFTAAFSGRFNPVERKATSSLTTELRHNLNAVSGLSPDDKAQEELNEILSGEMTYSLSVSVEFIEQEKTPGYWGNVTDLMAKADALKTTASADTPVVIPKFEMGRDKLDGRVYVQQCHSIGSGVTKVVANFNSPEDAYIYVTVKQAIARAGLTTDMFLKLFPPIENDKNR